jgi:hypothetical protein
MTTSDTPMAPAGLAAWANQSRIATRPAAMTSARAAMHSARVAAADVKSSPVGRLRVGLPRLGVLLQPRARLTAGALAGAAAVVVAVGWNAGPSSPLHAIQLARQDVSVALAGGTQGVDLRLQYAEARLRDAAAGIDRHDNLEEAASLLGAARQGLPAIHTDALWLRWSHDESVLASLLVAPAPSTDRSGSGRHDGAPSASTGSAAPGRGRDGRGGDDGSGAAPAAGPSASSPDHSRGRDSGSGSRPAPSPSVSGAGADSGGRGGGSSPQPSPTVDDGGKGGGGG